jgi:hypothetical protein
MNNQDQYDRLVDRLDQLLDRIEALLPKARKQPDWADFNAFHWRSDTGLSGVARPHYQRLDDLLCVEPQKAEMVRNTAQFVEGKPANNILLSGSRGTGKSTLVKAVFSAFEHQALRLIEIEKPSLLHLPELLDCLHDRPERFLLYCDDLSFEADDASYKAMKAVLEGTIAAPPANVLLYATSNRRHLMPEYMAENRETQISGGEIHPGETVEEKVSLSDRFGLWLSFLPFTQNEYLTNVNHWLNRLGEEKKLDEETRIAALRWATRRGSRSGRVARQFALDWYGRH